MKQPCTQEPSRGLLIWLLTASILAPVAFAGEAEDHRGHEHHQMPAVPQEKAVEKVTELRIPNAVVVDQDGQELHFFADLIRGRRVVMNFIFTTCTTICPPMGANFAKLRRHLDEEPRDLALLSVSVDPRVDTPSRLRAWRGRFGVEDGWTLVTGDKGEVDGLLKALGVFTANKWDHAPFVLIGDEPSGTWQRVYGLSEPAKILAALDELGKEVPPERSAVQEVPPERSAAPEVLQEVPPERSTVPQVPPERSTVQEVPPERSAVHEVPPERSTVSQVPPERSAVHEVPPERSAAPEVPPEQSAALSTGGQRYFTDVELVDQHGHKQRLYSDLLQGKVVVIHSFFGTCQGSCPVMLKTFRQIQDRLGDHIGRDVHLLSISVDPGIDTAERLAALATALGAHPGWYFLTGPQQNVDFALHKFGQQVDQRESHSNIFIIGNEPTGLWKKAFGLASGEEIVKVVEGVLADSG